MQGITTDQLPVKGRSVATDFQAMSTGHWLQRQPAQRLVNVVRVVRVFHHATLSLNRHPCRVPHNIQDM